MKPSVNFYVYLIERYIEVASELHNFILDNCSDEELLIYCKSGNQDALHLLFLKYNKCILNFLFSMISHKEDAEEALSDVFAKVWKSADKFRGDSSFKTWLYKIASNTAKDYLRKKQSKYLIFDYSDCLDLIQDSKENPENLIHKNEVYKAILESTSILNYDERLIFTLYHIQSFDYKQIHDITKENINNIKVKLYRIRKKIKNYLEKKGYSYES